jgi:prepilin-type N-terminal cleavage/methylation domain-containing protein
MNNHPRSGFTLIELLIVVVVVGILAVIAIPKLSGARERTFRAAVMSDLKSLAHAQELYHGASYTYSSDLSILGADETEGVTITINEATASGWAATAVHESVLTGQCGVYHGDASASNATPATAYGVVACDF